MSTTTTIAGALLTEYISPLMVSYAKKSIVALPHVRVENLADKHTKTASFYTATKNSASALTEGTDATATDITMSNTDVTVAEVGVVRSISKMALRTNILGEDGLAQWAIEDGGRLCFEKMEQDTWAVFSSASQTVGTTNTAFTLANFSAAYSLLEINDISGRVVALLTGKQVSDLRDALVASTATIFSNGSAGEVLAQKSPDGFVGNLFGVDIFTCSNLGPTANAGVDRVGAFMASATDKADECPIGLAALWFPEVATLEDPSNRQTEVAITACYGVGEILDRGYVKVVTRKES